MSHDFTRLASHDFTRLMSHDFTRLMSDNCTNLICFNVTTYVLIFLGLIVNFDVDCCMYICDYTDVIYSIGANMNAADKMIVLTNVLSVYEVVDNKDFSKMSMHV